MNDTLVINEIFHSIQGESTWAGLPCTFVRLTGCHLRCGYCDTEYAFHEGERMTVEEILEQAEAKSKIVEITGGEPLLQPNVHPLMTALCDRGHTVLIETSGACDISTCDERVIRIMDLKTPGSGEVERNLWSNIDYLNPRDEVKFVLCDREDYDWAKQVIVEHDLPARVNAVLMSAVVPIRRSFGAKVGEGLIPGSKCSPGHAAQSAKVSPSPNPSLEGRWADTLNLKPHTPGPRPQAPGPSLRHLAEWILADDLPVRLQTQLHKLIWPDDRRGV